MPAQADPSSRPRSGSFTVRGAGCGHGWGMSQYGAYGAARKGLTWKRILAFYYPGTKLEQMPQRHLIKVWVTADTDGSLRVLPARGLKVRDAVGGTLHRADRDRSTRPGGSAGPARATSSATATAAAATSTKSTGLSNGHLEVLQLGQDRQGRAAERVGPALPGLGGADQAGQRRPHGQPGAAGGLRPGVVPAEMPTSWAADAVRAQAVAARSYAVRLRDVRQLLRLRHL